MSKMVKLGIAAGHVSGARVQRPLWASTSTKNAAYRDVLYVDTLLDWVKSLDV